MRCVCDSWYLFHKVNAISTCSTTNGLKLGCIGTIYELSAIRTDKGSIRRSFTFIIYLHPSVNVPSITACYAVSRSNWLVFLYKTGMIDDFC